MLPRLFHGADLLEIHPVDSDGTCSHVRTVSGAIPNRDLTNWILTWLQCTPRYGLDRVKGS